MRSSCLAVLACLLVPTVAPAQRSRVGTVGAGKSAGDMYDDSVKQAMRKADATGFRLSTGDVEDISPIKLLVDRRKDLKLTDDQLRQIKDLAAKLKEKNQPLLKSVDSLRRESKPRLADPTPEERARMVIASNNAAGVVLEIRANYDAALNEALPLLDETQKKKADDLLRKQRTDADNMLREKLGAAGGRGN